MAAAKKATTRKTTTRKTAAPKKEEAPNPESSELVQVTPEEFYVVMNQLYPNETARVVAEIRSSKLEELVRELRSK